MKKKLLLLLMLFFLSCEKLSIIQKDQDNFFFFENINITENESNNLSIATFNMKLGFCQNCSPFNGDLGGSHEHLDRIVEMINELNLDIISLQEVGYDYDTSIVENQIKYIAEKTNMNYAFGVGRAFQTGANLFITGLIGNAILSKYEILNIENPTIRFIDYFNQNHCLKVRLKLNAEKEITFLSTHMESGGTSDEKIMQLNQILEVVKYEINPIVLAGDLNMNPYNQHLALLNDKFSNSLNSLSPNEVSSIFDTGTYISGSTIDYIYTSHNDFNIETGFISPTRYRDISDHFLYSVNLSLK